MTGRILVVDDILANAKLLEARLVAEYFDVTTATSGAQALSLCADDNFDLVLLDVMMPGLDGFETCRRLKSGPDTMHIPVVMVTALDQPSDRVKGLDAGADDFLTKPIDETALLARVRSLVRLKAIVDELRARTQAPGAIGMPEPLSQEVADAGRGGHILLVDDRTNAAERAVATLSVLHKVEVCADIQEALIRGAEGRFDLVIVSLSLTEYDALRLCSQIRSLERTRQLPILVLAELDDRSRILRALDIGVNDYLVRPLDRNELLARVRTQLLRKRYSDHLRSVLHASMELAIVDQLTGLHNRRFLESHLPGLMKTAANRNRPLAIMILDIDHFKAVNDGFGHDVGDDILRGFASRVRALIRHADLFCRLGGEEFIIVLPDTSMVVASNVAERIRMAVCSEPFETEQAARSLSITVSIGLADRGFDISPRTVMKRADRALYQSKASGRNRVSADAA